MPAVLAAGILVFVLAGCAGVAPPPALCAAGGVSIHADFPAAGQHRCLAVAGHGFIVRVDPEIAIDPPINPSPWYAFDVISDAGGPVSLTLDYGGYWHRYDPRIRLPGGDWQTPDAATVESLDEDHRIRLSLDVPPGRTRVAARPLLAPADIVAWAETFAREHGFSAVVYGTSANGRPLHALTAGPDEADCLVIALTRQHPPEHSGGLAFEAFAGELAVARQRGALSNCRLLLFPLINPDGVAHGHWRLNAGGIDLNRDWFAASQPEVAAARALIRREAAGRQTLAFLDFHSTRRTLVYNPPAGTASRGDALMADLATRLAAVMERPPDWVEGHNADVGTSKAWALQALGIAALTIELADDAAGEESRTVGQVAAQAVIAAAAPSSR